MSDKTKTFTRIKVKESMEIGSTLTVPSIISTSGVTGPAYTVGSTVTKTVDSTGVISGSYSTIALALAALSKESGDTGVIQLTEGQSYTLTDLNFSQCQRNYRRVVVKGTQAGLTNTTVASVANGGPGVAADAWFIPTVSDTIHLLI